MGFLARPEVRRVDLGDGFWADVRALSAGEYADVERHLSRSTVVGDKVDIQPDLSGFRRALVIAAISDWNLTDENDGPLPVAPERLRAASVDRLPVWAFEELRKVADEVNGTRRDQAKFRNADTDGDQVGVGGSADPAEVPDGSRVVAAVGAPVGAPGPDVVP